MRETSNVGQTGVKSIRIGGMVVDDLPIAEGAAAKEQLPSAIEAERQNRAANIKARFPKPSQDYVRSRIREAKKNIVLFQSQSGSVDRKRTEYTSLLSLCRHRDEEIEKLDQGQKDYADRVKDLREKFGPWDSKAMQTQIDQFGQTMARFDKAVIVETDAVAELRGVLVLCQERDSELTKLGMPIE